MEARIQDKVKGRSSKARKPGYTNLEIRRIIHTIVAVIQKKIHRPTSCPAFLGSASTHCSALPAASFHQLSAFLSQGDRIVECSQRRTPHSHLIHTSCTPTPRIVTHVCAHTGGKNIARQKTNLAHLSSAHTKCATEKVHAAVRAREMS